MNRNRYQALEKVVEAEPSAKRVALAQERSGSYAFHLYTDVGGKDEDLVNTLSDLRVLLAYERACMALALQVRMLHYKQYPSGKREYRYNLRTAIALHEAEIERRIEQHMSALKVLKKAMK